MKQFRHKKAGFEENSVAEYVEKYLKKGEVYNFGWGSLDPELILNEVPEPKYENKTIGVYNDSKGNSSVVEAVLKFIKTKSGKDISRDQIILTNGATNALFLLTYYFSNIKRTNSVIVQNPSYDTAINIFRSLGLNLVKTSPSCDILPETKNSFAYLMFNHHNPAGNNKRT